MLAVALYYLYSICQLQCPAMDMLIGTIKQNQVIILMTKGLSSTL